MLVGGRVGLAVAAGLEVLLGENVVVDGRVGLGMRVVGAGVTLAILDAVITNSDLHPFVIKNRNNPKPIPVINLIDILLFPVNRFMLDGSCIGSLL